MTTWRAVNENNKEGELICSMNMGLTMHQIQNNVMFTPSKESYFETYNVVFGIRTPRDEIKTPFTIVTKYSSNCY